MPEIFYQDVQDLLSGELGTASAAEAHGILSGLLCVDRSARFEQWMDCLQDEEDIKPSPYAVGELRQLFESTRRHFEDFDFAFQLLLPEDDCLLTERATALGEWCQGFLLGMGHGSNPSDWPAECTEILKDFVDIARLDADVAGESDEAAFAELTEYVRIGAQVIRSELQPARGETLH